MNVIVDTSVWSLVLRRSSPDPETTRIVNALVHQGRAQMLGIIRQELLSGVHTAERFEALRAELAHFQDLPVESEDHERAARLFNRCRTKGVQGSNIDFLICALALRHDLLVFTTDADFTHIAKVVHLKLFKP
jgi:predicted nucleic acid-binding protein